MSDALTSRPIFTQRFSPLPFAKLIAGNNFRLKSKKPRPLHDCSSSYYGVGATVVSCLDVRRKARLRQQRAVTTEVASQTTTHILPDKVEGYRVTAVTVFPSPPLPFGRSQVSALVVSDEEENEVDAVMWMPPAGSSAQQAISSLGDAFGVLGVWPAAWVAAEMVMGICRRRSQRPLRVLELGCGSGLPSLCALASGADVVATDLEELPLRLLEAAAKAQEFPGKLQTLQMDVLAAAEPISPFGGIMRNGPRCPSDSEAFDIIICSDCLYKHEVARAIAVLLSRALLRRPATLCVVTDANRRGRQEFLDTLAKNLGLGLGDSTPPRFEPTAVPSWAVDNARDPFDGTTTEEVGLLRLY